MAITMRGRYRTRDGRKVRILTTTLQQRRGIEAVVIVKESPTSETLYTVCVKTGESDKGRNLDLVPCVFEHGFFVRFLAHGPVKWQREVSSPFYTFDSVELLREFLFLDYK